jgi:hypothetical protein
MPGRQMPGRAPGELSLPARHEPLAEEDDYGDAPDRDAAPLPVAPSARHTAQRSPFEPDGRDGTPARHGRRIRIIWSELAPAQPDPEQPDIVASAHAAASRDNAAQKERSRPPPATGEGCEEAPIPLEREFQAQPPRRTALPETGASPRSKLLRWVQRLFAQARRQPAFADTPSDRQPPREPAERPFASPARRRSAQAPADFATRRHAHTSPAQPDYSAPARDTAPHPRTTAAAILRTRADDTGWAEHSSGPLPSHHGFDTGSIARPIFPRLPDTRPAPVVVAAPGPSPRIASPPHAGETPWSG